MSQTDPMVGHLLDGRYQVRARIARGGMATVYLATDLRLERRVAVKVMHGHLADDAAFRDRFIQEARSAARLAHPNVVNVFDQGQDSDMAYLVMEYLQGITLRDLLKEYGKLTPEQTMDIMEAVLAGLAASHKAGIVHRDLKPENVLLADDGRIKISDFGLARAATANTATGQALLGTIAYLSPELVTRGIADTRSDIYAVGIMMYEMLVGEQPYKGDQPVQIAYQHANERVPSPSAKNSAVPQPLDELVLWATARDPEQRPRDARTLLDQLFDTQNMIREGTSAPVTGRTTVLPAATGKSVPKQETSETQVLSRARRTGPVTLDSATKLSAATKTRHRRGFWIAALVVLLVALAGGTGWYLSPIGPGGIATVPTELRSMTLDEAKAAIAEAGFTVGEITSTYDVDVPQGLISASVPAGGESLAKGKPVALIQSLGAELLAIPAGVVGSPADQARTTLESSRFRVAQDPVEFFDAEVPAGNVIALRNGDAQIDTTQTLAEQTEITLVTSLGAVPNVVNIPIADAEAALTNAGLEFELIGEEFDNSGGTPDGNVLRVQAPEGPIQKGATFGLVRSKGVEQVTVPSVVGLSWFEAKPILEGAGVLPSYSSLADAAPSSYVVSSVTPGAGARVNKGSQVSVNFTL